MKSNKESEIKELLELGLTAKEIATSLGVCIETVHRKSRKFGLRPHRGLSKAYSINTAPEDLKQLVLGSLLGDGTFIKGTSLSYCMSISHSERQLSYIEYKASILKKYRLTSGIVKFTQYDKRYKHSFVGYRMRSRTNPLFKEIRDRFYDSKGKNLTDASIFRDLSPMGLAIWYMDDGYVTKHSCIFSTVSIPLDTQVQLAEILLEKFELHFTVGHNDNSMYLCASDFDRFKELILPYVTNDLMYKLTPYRHRVLDKSDELLESCDANQQPSLGLTA